MRALAIAVVVCVSASAEAAPWSIELPEGYTEQPGAAEPHVAPLRARDSTVSVDGQLYASADEQVHLLRITWVLRIMPTRAAIAAMDDGASSAASKQGFTHISDERHWVGDQLVGESFDELGDMKMHHRRLYSVDGSGVVHMVSATCMGSSQQLGPCEQALQSMQLTLPDQAAVPQTSPKPQQDLAYLIGRVVGGLLVVGLMIWLVVWRRSR